MKQEHTVNIIFTNRKACGINEDTHPYPSSSNHYHVVGYGSTSSSCEENMKIEFREKFCFCKEEGRKEATVPNLGNTCKQNHQLERLYHLSTIHY